MTNQIKVHIQMGPKRMQVYQNEGMRDRAICRSLDPFDIVMD
jgi:hypothetical protein